MIILTPYNLDAFQRSNREIIVIYSKSASTPISFHITFMPLEPEQTRKKRLICFRINIPENKLAAFQSVGEH